MRGRGSWKPGPLFSLLLCEASLSLRSSRSLRLKISDAGHCLVGSRDQGIRLCPSQLALRSQRAYLISEAGEVDQRMLGLALRELRARTVKFAEQARSVLLVLEGLSSRGRTVGGSL